MTDPALRRRFAIDILRGLHDPVNQNNVTAMLAWMQAEGGSARFNPMNTTLARPGATAYNSVGVRNYRTYQQGLEATLATLENGRYAGILGALRKGQSPYAVSGAISRSPWGTSGSLVSSIIQGWGGHAPGSGQLPRQAAAAGGGPIAPIRAAAPGGGYQAYGQQVAAGNIAAILQSATSAPQLTSRNTLANLFPQQDDSQITPPQPLITSDPRTPGGTLSSEQGSLDTLRRQLLKL